MMPFELLAIDHVQVTVPHQALDQTLRFYEVVLRLERIEKPDALARNGGAWYRLGGVELHGVETNRRSTTPTGLDPCS